MTAVLQKHARKYQLPIDKLQYQFTVLSLSICSLTRHPLCACHKQSFFGLQVLDQYHREDIEAAPDDGVYIDGLFMDGARWDTEKKIIADSHLGELFSSVPIIHFLPSDTYEPNPQVTTL